MKKISILLVLCVVVVFGSSFNVGAVTKSTSKKVRALTKNMNEYEYYALSSKGTKNKLKINKKNIATASALAIKSKKYIKDKGSYTYYSVSKNKIKKLSKNLFGKKVTYKKLRKKSQKRLCGAFKKNGKAIVYYLNRENEIDFKRISTKVIPIEGKKIVVWHKVYYGYWNSYKGKANYLFTYTLKKCKKSKYGYKIIRIKYYKR